VQRQQSAVDTVCLLHRRQGRIGSGRRSVVMSYAGRRMRRRGMEDRLPWDGSTIKNKECKYALFWSVFGSVKWCNSEPGKGDQKRCRKEGSGVGMRAYCIWDEKPDGGAGEVLIPSTKQPLLLLARYHLVVYTTVQSLLPWGEWPRMWIRFFLTWHRSGFVAR